MSEDDPKPKRRGRPPAPEDKKRRHNLTFRIRSDLREQIEASAQKNGRSMSEELELIIERSLWTKSSEESFRDYLAQNARVFSEDDKRQAIRNLKFSNNPQSSKISGLILEKLLNIEGMLKTFPSVHNDENDESKSS